MHRRGYKTKLTMLSASEREATRLDVLLTDADMDIHKTVNKET